MDNTLTFLHSDAIHVKLSDFDTTLQIMNLLFVFEGYNSGVNTLLSLIVCLKDYILRNDYKISATLANDTQRYSVNNLTILFNLLLSVGIPRTETTNDNYSFDRCSSLISLVIATSSTTTGQRVGLNYVNTLFCLPANTNIFRHEL